MAIEPNNAAWQRNRTTSHGGAIRNYTKSNEEGYPKGPNGSPIHCATCATESQYDTTSPDTFFQYTYTGDIFSPENRDGTSCISSSFDMKGKMLQNKFSQFSLFLCRTSYQQLLAYLSILYKEKFLVFNLKTFYVQVIKLIS